MLFSKFIYLYAENLVEVATIRYPTMNPIKSKINDQKKESLNIA